MNIKLIAPILVVALATLVATRLTLQRSARSMEALQTFAFELLQKEHPDWALERVDKNSIRIQVRGQIGHIYLDNILRTAGSDRTLAGKLIEKSAQQLSQQPEMSTGNAATPRLDDVKSHLRPTLVPHDYARRFELSGKVFADDLWEALVIDSPQSTRYVRTLDLSAWQVELNPLLHLAESALWQDIRALPLIAESPTDSAKPGKFIGVDTHDGYAAARLALPEFRDALAKELSYPFYAAVPNRDFLIAWSKDYAFADQFAAKVSEDFRTRSHPISSRVYRVDADRLESLK